MTAPTRHAEPLDIAITQYFDAPRDLVFSNWTDARLVSAWFAPSGFRVTQCEFHPRVGGHWAVTFVSPSGERHTESGEIQELVAPERLVFTLTQRDARGAAGPSTVVTVAFEQVGDKTRMDFLQSGFVSESTRDGNAEGWHECFRKLTGEVIAQSTFRIS